MNAQLVDLARDLSMQGEGDSQLRAQVEIERIEVTRAGGLTLSVRAGFDRRMFSIGQEKFTELKPDEDPELPIASRLQHLRKSRTIQVLAYRPGRRVVVRAGPPGASVILKGYRRGRLDAALKKHEVATLAARGSGIRVPAILGRADSASFFTMEDFGQRELHLNLADASDFTRLGESLSTFREFETRIELEQRGPKATLADLDRLQVRFAAADALLDPLPEEWRRLREGLEQESDRLPDVAPTLIHRDLHDGQLQALASGLGLLDFDMLSRGDPVQDVANLAVHLELRGMQHLGGVDAVRLLEFASKFVDAACPEPGRGFQARLGFYRASTLLRLALVYRMRPPWSSLVPLLIQKAAEGEKELHGLA